MKLFKIRLQLYFKDSESKYAGILDINVIAETENLAKKYALKYKGIDKNIGITGIVSTEENKIPLIIAI